MRPKKRRTPKRFLVMFAVFLIFFSSGGYSYAALKKTPPPLQVATIQTQVPASIETPLPWPVNGQAAIGSTEQGVLAHSGEEKPMPTASMTKVMTALAVVTRDPIALNEQGKTYTIEAQDVALYNEYVAKLGTVAPVSQGETLTQRRALEYLLVISANNIADTLVRHHFGSMEAYTEYANNLALEYGLEHTTITDASGFAPTTVSTPSDLIKLGTKALAHPVIAEIVATRSINVPGLGEVRNSNLLLREDSLAIGIKTGATDEAGKCLLFAVQHVLDSEKTVTIIGAVMGAQSYTELYDTVRGLLKQSKEYFGKVTVLEAGAKIAEFTSEWGVVSDIVTKNAVTYYGWLGSVPEYSISVSKVVSPIDAGQDVGVLTLDSSSQLTVRLIARDDIRSPSVWWRLRNFL